ncbi:gamma-glutamyltransferase family protein [Muricoccus pecuniae]|uniref:Gamma-glutamyltranspeptidase/glutathione hydrolase n=1 Tax=Muricoccus pecuniae TaxID=693023 RepID=A0A840YA96_9PROT|nr:gamma-glutamyltransferase [Roseomonas pecuniae]MBB5693277.1 gamma-glutamyltranspeptidase/glutathione hydrolase [Roseomonas pecuniae]
MPGFTTRPELRGTFGAVASTHWLASAAGMGVLERGGNAFDAAAAAGFVLQVVEPHLNGPGGDAPIIACPAGAEEPVVICGQGPSPAAATMERLRGLGLDLVPGSGLLPACVPGAFGAWMTLLLEHGTAPLREVLAPAIFYAREGHPLVPRIPAAIASVRELFETHWPSSAEIYLPGGRVPESERLFRNPALAETYERLLADAETAGGREGQIRRALDHWYRGPVAEAVDRYYREAEVWDVSGRRNRGLLTGQDMAAWKVPVERPIHADHGRFRVFKCGAWSQGPSFLQAINILSGFDLARMDPVGPDFVHVVAEAIKLAFADRDCWYGDSAPVPLEALLSADYAAARRALIGEQASHEFRPGSPEGRAPVMPPLSPAGTLKEPRVGTGEPTVAREDARATDRAGEALITAGGTHRGDTCHVDVVDRWGNMVAATPSGGWLQSSPVVPGLGFSITVRGQMFWLKEGLASSMAPGVRPRTTLTPSFAYRDGKPYLAFGTPGGDQQEQWSLLLFLHHAHHGMNLQEAIDAPAFHTDHAPSSFWPRETAHGTLTLEGRFPAATVEELRRRGHGVTLGDDWSEGRLSACAREADGEGHVVKAAANPRGMQGYAVAR